MALNQNLFDGERILLYFGDGNPEIEGRVRPPEALGKLFHVRICRGVHNFDVDE